MIGPPGSAQSRTSSSFQGAGRSWVRATRVEFLPMSGGNRRKSWRGFSRFWCRLWSPIVPDPWPGGAWHCPRCGRRLVGQGRPGRTTLRWESMTRDQLIKDCLVDGAAPELRDQQVDVESELRSLVADLDRDGEERWITWLQGCDRAGVERAFCLAHYLWHLRRDRCYASDTSRIDRLLFGIGSSFPETAPRPPGNPLSHRAPWP
jgi:hypothetical protein